MNPIPVTVIGGYLGAGKTTLLNALLRNESGTRFAVLVNDFGSINVDAEAIASTGADTIELTNGCTCCTIGGDLVLALKAVLARPEPPDAIVIEASGVARPGGRRAAGRLPSGARVAGNDRRRRCRDDSRTRRRQVRRRIGTQAAAERRCDRAGKSRPRCLPARSRNCARGSRRRAPACRFSSRPAAIRFRSGSSRMEASPASLRDVTGEAKRRPRGDVRDGGVSLCASARSRALSRGDTVDDARAGSCEGNAFVCGRRATLCVFNLRANAGRSSRSRPPFGLRDADRRNCSGAARGRPARRAGGLATRGNLEGRRVSCRLTQRRETTAGAKRGFLDLGRRRRRR